MSGNPRSSSTDIGAAVDDFCQAGLSGFRFVNLVICTFEREAKETPDLLLVVNDESAARRFHAADSNALRVGHADRQCDDETRAAAVAILGSQCAAVGFDEATRDRQSEAEPAGFASIAAIKFLEHSLHGSDRKPRSPVAH